VFKQIVNSIFQPEDEEDEEDLIVSVFTFNLFPHKMH